MRDLLLVQAFNTIRNRPQALVEDVDIWIGRLPELEGQQQELAAISLSRQWGKEDPEAAAQWVSNIPEGGIRIPAIRGLVWAWAKTEPGNASGWVAALPPGDARDQGALALTQTISRELPYEAWEWAMSISSPHVQSQGLAQILEVLGQDHGVANAELRQLVDETNLDAQIKDQLFQGIDTP